MHRGTRHTLCDQRGLGLLKQLNAARSGSAPDTQPDFGFGLDAIEISATADPVRTKCSTTRACSSSASSESIGSRSTSSVLARTGRCPG